MTRPLLAAASRAVVATLGIFAVAIVALGAVPAPVAAETCTLSAMPIPGREIDLAGSGFPASTSVTITVERNGGPAPSIVATSDASGAFAVSVGAGPGLGGAYSFTATGGGCSATASAVAVETAGGGTAGGGAAGGATPEPAATAGPGATMPPTDTVPALDRRRPAEPWAGVALGLAVVLLFAATALARPVRSIRRK